MSDPFVEAAKDIKPANEFKKAASEMSYVKWLPYMGLKPQHPLAGIESNEIRDAKEVFEFFKESFPDDPFGYFMDHLNRLPMIPTNETKIHQVTNYVRMLKLATRHKEQAKRLNKELRKLKA